MHFNYSHMVVSIGLDSDHYDWKDRVFLITEDEEVNFFYLKTRITSYNVCYTKLLRDKSKQNEKLQTSLEKYLAQQKKDADHCRLSSYNFV